MTHDNILYDLSKKFALRVIKLYPFLCNEKSEFIISKQIYRSGTSIGANIAESMNAQSKADFVNKLSISLKDATETKYMKPSALSNRYHVIPLSRKCLSISPTPRRTCRRC